MIAPDKTDLAAKKVFFEISHYPQFISRAGETLSPDRVRDAFTGVSRGADNDEGRQFLNVWKCLPDFIALQVSALLSEVPESAQAEVRYIQKRAGNLNPETTCF